MFALGNIRKTVLNSFGTNKDYDNLSMLNTHIFNAITNWLIWDIIFQLNINTLYCLAFTECYLERSKGLVLLLLVPYFLLSDKVSDKAHIVHNSFKIKSDLFSNGRRIIFLLLITFSLECI